MLLLKLILRGRPGVICLTVAHSEELLVQGGWSALSRGLHINILKLCAVRFALASFPDILQGKMVLVQTDNMSNHVLSQ